MLIFYEEGYTLGLDLFVAVSTLQTPLCVYVSVSRIFPKVSTKLLLRPGWCQVAVQWSINTVHVYTLSTELFSLAQTHLLNLQLL